MISIGIIIISIIIGLIWGIYNYEKIFGTFVGIVIGVFIMVIASLIVGCCSDITYTVLKEQTICAIEDNNNVAGSFFLGCGNVNGNMQYIYLVKNEFGLEMKTISCDKVTINDKLNKASITTYIGQYNNKFLRNNFISCGTKIVINVPKGTIKYNFNVDLK